MNTFHEFRAYWQLSEELIADATKEDLAEVARILGMQAADTWSKSVSAKTLHEQELNNTKNTRASTESDAPALASYPQNCE